MFCTLQPKGRGFDSTSSQFVATLDKFSPIILLSHPQMALKLIGYLVYKSELALLDAATCISLIPTTIHISFCPPPKSWTSQALPQLCPATEKF